MNSLRNLSKWCQGLAVGFLVVWLIVTFSPLVFWLATLLAGPWTDPAGRTLIVLAGSQQTAEIPGYSSYLRTYYAVSAWRDGFQYVVFSGGPREHPVSHSMAQFAACYGIPTHLILTEDQSTSTRENALFLRPLLASLPQPYVLLTSDIHMYRAKRVFEKLGIPVLPRPIPDVRKRYNQWTERWGLFLSIAVEFGKILYYKAAGWI